MEIEMNDQTNQEAAPEVEVTVKINKADYDFAVKCLNAAHARLITGRSSEANHQARIEIDWALVGLGQDIPA
jgi:hypothetical protein